MVVFFNGSCVSVWHRLVYLVDVEKPGDCQSPNNIFEEDFCIPVDTFPGVYCFYLVRDFSCRDGD